MPIINLTEHDIVVLEGNTSLVFAPEGIVARLIEKNETPAGYVDGVCLVDVENTGEIQNLPEPVEGVFLITSTAVQKRAWALGRTDVIAPNTGETALRKDGRVVAVRSFRRFVSKV